MSTPDRDLWSAWLLRRRDGRNLTLREQMLEQLGPIRDQVLADAQIRPGDRVLDMGCGDGLIGFGAAELVGPDGVVVFSAISAELLQLCRRTAGELGIVERCETRCCAPGPCYRR